MKKIIIAPFATLILLGGCFTSKQPKVTYVFPDEMRADVKEGFIEMWKKGEILYQINCAECHNQKVKGKMIIPEFTDEMLAAYEIRVSDPEHEMALSDTRVTIEELTYISTFLTYRERDSVALKKLMAMPRDHDHDSPM